MSSKNVNSVTKSKRYVIVTPIEITVLFIIFLVVLFLLYPKGKLEQHILQERSNYDLTSIYLQNLIRLQPDNSKLVLSMANTLYQQKKYHLALNLIDILKHDKDKLIRQKASLVHLNINMAIADKESNPKRKALLLKENDHLLQNISHQKLMDINDTKTLYYAALSIGDKDSALKFSMNIFSLADGDEALKWSKNSHYLASELHKTKEDREALFYLIRHDRKNRSIWIDALKPLINRDDDIDFLAKTLLLKGEILANFYVSNQYYSKAISIYKNLYQRENKKEKKRDILLNMIKVFKMNNKSTEIVDVVKEYEDLYLSDSKIVKLFLKLYLETNHANFAKELSLKIINQKDI